MSHSLEIIFSDEMAALHLTLCLVLLASAVLDVEAEENFLTRTVVKRNSGLNHPQSRSQKTESCEDEVSIPIDLELSKAGSSHIDQELSKD
ncbi:hypothetical protein J6590_099050 [Homalodisca vitripennis]|nr:hypothetical protein J6590_099050 [Homalodisca vitripennis]